ncbi:MAG TPA: UvrD-helicase domain-containing protein [Chlamydiales bacterium]|nr:UvrD-helicase domain-containing protein [Chlamydiales bacterium]
MHGLNKDQEKAVRTIHGRVLILAGAGSGKTRVIVHRIAHLIKDHHVDPSQIVGLTFTNKAAAEMRHRLESLIGANVAKKVILATFHSFCMHILRKEIALLGYTRDFSLYDERDLERMVQQIAKEMLGIDKDLPSLASTHAAIAQASNMGGEKAVRTWHDQFSKDVYLRLQTTLRAHNAVNFDNLINLSIQLFEQFPEVLDRYQEQFRYFLIDEFQDTNPAQLRLAELLAKKYRNLCVVGDDDQSIYGWRGAQIAGILEFKADSVIKLEQNYRSLPTILNAANAVIQNNKNRHNKKLWTSENFEEPIEVFNAPSDSDEANAVIHRLIHFHKQGIPWKDMAILYRSNALSRNLEMALINASWQRKEEWVRGIPYEVFGGLEFSERSEIKDLLSFLRVIANPKDQEALLRIINVPRRGISDQFLDELTKFNRSSNTPLWEVLCNVTHEQFPTHRRGVQGVHSFVNLIRTAQNRFANPPLHEALQWFLEAIHYKKAIEEDVKSDKMRDFKWENVQECVNALSAYEKDNAPILQSFIADTALKPTQFATKKENDDRVHLMTLHSAKGLEFPVCFIVGLEDHILPHEKSREITGIEEERRLFYVGITRSRKKLILSMARARMRMGKAVPTNPSRFLFEIPKTLLKVTAHDCHFAS